MHPWESHLHPVIEEEPKMLRGHRLPFDTQHGPSPCRHPGCSKSPVLFFWSTGHIHLQCSDIHRDGVLLNIESTKPSKGSDTIKSDLNVDTRHFPQPPQNVPRYILWSPNFFSKLPLERSSHYSVRTEQLHPSISYLALGSHCLY